jgi:hypothetical protein
MTPSRSLLASLLFACTFVPACEDEGPTVHDQVTDYVEEINQQIAVYCDCWEQMGYASNADCTGDYGYLGPSQQSCIEDALARDEGAAQSWLGCVLDLERNYTECVDARLTCQDASSDDACLDDYEIGYAGCIQLPENVSRGLEDCAPASSSGGGGGGGVCDFDWTNTDNENNCPSEWNGDGGCDCGCQFADVDCGG